MLPALQQLDNTHIASDAAGFSSPNMTSRLLNKDSTACIVATEVFTQATEDFTVVAYTFCCSTSVLKNSPGPAYTMQDFPPPPLSSQFKVEWAF